MISNPLDAIGNCKTRSQLAGVLEELMAFKYPDGNKEGWEIWTIKYDSIITAKKAAVHMYRRVLGI